jgi:hypothetical protein
MEYTEMQRDAKEGPEEPIRRDPRQADCDLAEAGYSEAEGSEDPEGETGAVSAA